MTQRERASTSGSERGRGISYCSVDEEPYIVRIENEKWDKCVSQQRSRLIEM